MLPAVLNRPTYLDDDFEREDLKTLDFFCCHCSNRIDARGANGEVGLLFFASAGGFWNKSINTGSSSPSHCAQLAKRKGSLLLFEFRYLFDL